MNDTKHTAPFDMEMFIRLHGLERLPPEQVSRMAELAPRIAELGASLPRPLQKSTAPAERGKLTRIAS
jgi:hypothetical protein